MTLHLLMTVDNLLIPLLATWPIHYSRSCFGSQLARSISPGIQQMISAFASVIKAITTILRFLVIGSMPVDHPTWGSAARRESRQSRQRRRESEKSEESEEESCTPPRQSRSPDRDAHATDSDEAIEDANELGIRIAHNNDVMRQCKQTFDTLTIRNQRLVEKYESMRNRMAIPTWGSASASTDAPMPQAPIRTFQEALTTTGNKIPLGPPPAACVVNPAAQANPAAAPINPRSQ